MIKQVKTHNLWSFFMYSAIIASNKTSDTLRRMHTFNVCCMFCSSAPFFLSQSHIFLTNSLHITLLSAIWLGQRGIFVASRMAPEVLDSRCFVCIIVMSWQHCNNRGPSHFFISVFPTIGGVPPKMDGVFWKNLLKWMIWGENLLFLETFI